MSTPLHAVEAPRHEPPRPVEPPPQDEPFPLLDYLQLLWFRRRVIVLLTLLAALLGYLHVNQLQSIYTARSTLMIGVVEGQPLDYQQAMYQRYFGLDTQQEIEVLRSRGLAEKTIERLNLLNHPEFNPSLRVREPGAFDWLSNLNPLNWIPDSWRSTARGASTGELVVAQPDEEEQARREMVRAVNIFLGKLSISPIEMTSIINISFRSPDPQLATRIANELPETYILDKLEAKLESAERLSEWLSQQLADLERKVRDSEQAVELYRIEHGFTEVAGGDLLTEQLSAINSQLIIAKAERAEAEARLAQVERLINGNFDGIESADLLSSPMIQQLRGQEAEIQRRKTELSVEFGPKHPRMLQVNAELEDIGRRVEEEIDKVVLGLENEVEVAKSREASLEGSLREAESASGLQNREAIQLRALEREAAANRALYETFLSRFKETSTTEGTETPDARVLSAAEVPTSPSYPNRKRTFMMIVFMGFLASCALVIGLHLMSPGMLSPEQIEQQLGVHVIGLVPKLTGKQAPYEHVMKKSGSGYVEAINSLNISLKLTAPDTKIQAIQVTSSVPEEGKTSLILSLAVVLAKTGKKVIVVDGDLRRSSIEKKLGLDAKGPGLTDFVIADTDDVSGFISTHEDSGVDLMRTGEGKFVSATDLFSSARMQHVIDLLKQRYDYILVDAPPVMAVADARVIGQVTDTTIFAVRWNKTPKKVAKAALDLLRKSDIQIAGVVLQQVDLKRYGRLGYGDSGYYYHYGRYGQYYS